MTSDTALSVTIYPVVGNISSTIAIESIRHGQPRPYADHEDVWRVHFVKHNPYLHSSESQDPNRYRASSGPSGDEWVDKRLNDQIEEAIRLVHADHLPRGRTPDVWNQPDWLVYAKHLAPGVVEVFVQRTYFD